MGEHSAETSDTVGRLTDLRRLTGAPLPRREPTAIVIPEAARPLIPVPRRSRVFLRHGEGHGAFADFTVTAPYVRHVTD